MKRLLRQDEIKNLLSGTGVTIPASSAGKSVFLMALTGIHCLVIVSIILMLLKII